MVPLVSNNLVVIICIVPPIIFHSSKTTGVAGAGELQIEFAATVSLYFLYNILVVFPITTTLGKLTTVSTFGKFSSGVFKIKASVPFILYNILDASHLITLVLVSKLKVSVIKSPSSQLVNNDKLKNRIKIYFICI